MRFSSNLSDSARVGYFGLVIFIVFLFVFFFQAEDGIRDLYVTGVQTCALPIWASYFSWPRRSTGAIRYSFVPSGRARILPMISSAVCVPMGMLQCGQYGWPSRA